jgi:hypothetical protein
MPALPMSEREPVIGYDRTKAMISQLSVEFWAASLAASHQPTPSLLQQNP